jgi:hypothetical protein
MGGFLKTPNIYLSYDLAPSGVSGKVLVVHPKLAVEFI